MPESPSTGQEPDSLPKGYRMTELGPLPKDWRVVRLGEIDKLSAHVAPDLRGVLLGLVEVYQRQERWEDATACLERLQRLEPDDVVVKLSLAELLLQARPGDKTNRQDSRIVKRYCVPKG